MRIICGDIWQQNAWLTVPTNLSINKDGLAVMGRGIAFQASARYRDLPLTYAAHLRTAEQPSLYLYPQRKIICLPVKRYWGDQADLSMIEEGVKSLAVQDLPAIALPLLGCGFGDLDVLDVLPILAHYLIDDRFTLVLRDPEATKRHANSLKPGIRRDRTMR